MLPEIIHNYNVSILLCGNTDGLCNVAHILYNNPILYTWSVRKVSDRIFLCEHLMDYNLARLHEPTLNLSAHA